MRAPVYKLERGRSIFPAKNDAERTCLRKTFRQAEIQAKNALSTSHRDERERKYADLLESKYM